MENKSPYVLIGAAVLVFLAGLVGSAVWKLRAGDATSYAYYSILFSGEVQGLTNDSPVFYRGLRVGRVTSISLTSRAEPAAGAVGDVVGDQRDGRAGGDGLEVAHDRRL